MFTPEELKNLGILLARARYDLAGEETIHAAILIQKVHTLAREANEPKPEKAKK